MYLPGDVQMRMIRHTRNKMDMIRRFDVVVFLGNIGHVKRK